MPTLGILLAALLFGGYKLMTRQVATGEEQILNYRVSFVPPAGWVKRKPSASSLFLYHKPEWNAYLRGGHSDVVGRYNPTPELDTNGIAEYFLDTTRRLQKGWTATRLDDVLTDSERFSVLNRQNDDHRVLTCFIVKGNTTFVISLSSYETTPAKGEKLYKELRNFLGSIRLEPDPEKLARMRARYREVSR